MLVLKRCGGNACKCRPSEERACLTFADQDFLRAILVNGMIIKLTSALVTPSYEHDDLKHSHVLAALFVSWRRCQRRFKHAPETWRSDVPSCTLFAARPACARTKRCALPELLARALCDRDNMSPACCDGLLKQ